MKNHRGNICASNTIMMTSIDLIFDEEQQIKKLDFIFVGEEGVGKSSLINFLLQEDRAPISDMHTKTWKLTKYTTKVNNVVFNYHDIPGIEGKYSDETIAAEFVDKRFDLIVCCLDGTRIRPSGMVRKSISFIEKYIPDTPVLFVVTKENVISNNMNNRINEIKSSVREIANSKFRHFGLISVGNNIIYSKSDKFWREIITCLPNIEILINENFTSYKFEKEDIHDHVQEFFTSNYKSVPEIATKLRSKEYAIRNMKIVFGFFAYLYVGLCTFAIISGVDCYSYELVRIVAVFYFLCLVLLKLIIGIYSTNYYGLFPVYVENADTSRGLFTGTINFISKDKYYTRVDGVINIDNSTYTITANSTNCCFFELCDNKFFENYYEVVKV